MSSRYPVWGAILEIRICRAKSICRKQIRSLRRAKRRLPSALAARLQTMGIIMEQDVISRIESCDRLVTDCELHAFAVVLGVDIIALLAPEDP